MLVKFKSLLQNSLIHITFSLMVLFMFSCGPNSESTRNNSFDESVQLLPEKTLSLMDTMVIFDPETYTESVEVKQYEYKLLAIVDTLYQKSPLGKETLTITEIYASPELKIDDLKRIKTKVLDTLLVFDPATKTETTIIRKYQSAISKIE